MLKFEPSKYQREIFDFVQHGQGNGIISATAGSGKTTTLVSLIDYIPNNLQCLFVAFNKAITEKLSDELKGHSNVTVRTAHSLGFNMITKNYGQDIQLDEFKYDKFLIENINTLTDNKTITDFYIQNIKQLIHLGRYNLAQSVKELKRIADKYCMLLSADECEVALKCLKWGKKDPSCVDYTDLLWLPNENCLRPFQSQFDWIIIDECQDLSMACIKLIQKCIKRGTRIISCGDINQQIYTFSGASDEAFETLRTLPHTSEFTLPISYRCSKKIVKLANNLVPKMMAADNAIDGEILYDTNISDINSGDMVIARNKLPLLQLYKLLLKNNIKSYIKKNDDDFGLDKIITNLSKHTNLSTDLSQKGVFSDMFQVLFDGVYKLMTEQKLSKSEALLHKTIIEFYDNIMCLQTLAEDCDDVNCLKEKINQLYMQTDNAICLSTIHKAKGLENDSVHILCHSAIPSILAKADWELKQERNLLYVAYTRPKKKLTFISEDLIPNSYNPNRQNEYIKQMELIEVKLNNLNEQGL